MIARIGQVAYKLALPPSAKVHLVFDVSLLKKKVGSSIVPSPHLPQGFDSNKATWLSAKILDQKLFKKGNVGEMKWLIQWVNGL